MHDDDNNEGDMLQLIREREFHMAVLTTSMGTTQQKLDPEFWDRRVSP